MLMFLRELIRSDDAGAAPNDDLLMAAGGCRSGTDLQEIWRYSVERGWTGSNKLGSAGTSPNQINLPARMYVDQRTRDLGQGRQGFVAMWFDPSMDKAYKKGIKPAICAAGYKPRLIKEKDFLGKVDDEIVAEIRRSRFIVADFTASKKAGARGGVYYEAGFAQGLGIDVIHTCRQDRMKAVHFDTNHFNHIVWKKPKDLREQLQRRIEAILGQGPLNPSSDER